MSIEKALLARKITSVAADVRALADEASSKVLIAIAQDKNLESVARRLHMENDNGNGMPPTNYGERAVMVRPIQQMNPMYAHGFCPPGMSQFTPEVIDIDDVSIDTLKAIEQKFDEINAMLIGVITMKPKAEEVTPAVQKKAK